MERIQESDGAPKTPKVVSVALVMLGGACIVFAAMALGGKSSAPPAAKADPLGELVNARGQKPAASGAVKATDLSPSDVTFPGILSDDGKPTTALAAVKGGGAAPAASATVVVTTDPATAPPPGDRLAVVPLPAQNVLEATPLVTRPRDGLTKAAADAQSAPAAAGSAASGPGHDGGYQLQVSSFRTQEEASAFADQLRARGHKAYVIEAKVPSRGTWYRVRIGPFATQHAAASYRTTFEQREHVVPFIVPPTTTK
jgi:cell division septation protein DedD